MMWGGLFVQRHLTTDQRSLFFDEIAPLALLASHKSDMYAYFDRSFIRHQHWIKNQVKLFGD